MDEETISESIKYLVSFETRFIVQADNYDKAVEKMKLEIMKKMNEPDPIDTNFSIHSIDAGPDEDHQLSYVDDWEFDDLW